MTERARRLRLTFFGTLALFIVGAVALTGYTLWRLRADAVSNGLELSALHARSFEDFVTQSLRVTELAAANVLPSEQATVDLHQIERSFVTTLRHAPFLRSMSLLDDHGRIVASSNPANVGIRVATDSYLPATTDRLEILRIGQPWSGRDFAAGWPSAAQMPVAAAAQSFIPLTRTLALGEGTATLLVALNPDYFINHMAQKLDDAQGTTEVLRLDGTLLMDTDPQARPGLLHNNSDRQFGDIESGQFEQHDDPERQALTAFRASKLYPFVVITHLRHDYALRHWRSTASTLIAIVLAALLAVSLLAIAFYRRQSLLAAQRAQSERLQRINAACVFTNAREGIMITNAKGSILDVNDAFSRITGYRRDDVLGQNPRLLSSGR